MSDPKLTPEEIEALDEALRMDRAREAYEASRAEAYRERMNDRDNDTMMWRRDQ